MYVNHSSPKFISICGLQANNITKRNPGVRPTGIDKVLWRRIGKSILKIVGDVHDMKQVTKRLFVP